MKSTRVTSLSIVVIIQLFLLSALMANAAPVSIETRIIHGHPSEEILDGKPLPPNDPFRKLRQFELEERRSQIVYTKGEECSSQTLALLDGQQLTDAIRNANLPCINSLFSVTGSVGYQLFNQKKMTTVTEAVNSISQDYTGDNSQGLQQLMLYLRAGYYVQFYQPDIVGEYDSGLTKVTQKALDTFFASPNAFMVSDENGAVLGEAVTLIDSSVQNERYIFVVKRLLTSYDKYFEASRNMTIAANNGMTVLFRGHEVKAFVKAVEKDNSLLDDLYYFYNTKQHLLGTDNEYLLINTVRELGRFVQHKSLQSKVRGQLKAILSQQEDTETGLPLWLAAADIASYYDSKNCDYYGICNFKDDVENSALPFRHTCGQTLKIRAQNMTTPQAQWICEQLSGQETYFHTRLATNDLPVANDLNKDLELVIFNSSQDYQLYAGILFNISTDNGGMYLEGDPDQIENQARFIAYEAEWEQPEFHVWNLRHEYVHYLDGRFNMAGDFNRSISTDTIWWIEGLGEYIARQDENPEAVSDARTKQYPLSTIFLNTYSSGETRVYRWGYLAVRFLFERYPNEVFDLLSMMRNDDYGAFKSRMDTIGSRYDDEWYGWLDTVESTENYLPEFGPPDDMTDPDDGNEPPDTGAPVTDHNIANPILMSRLPKIGLSSDKNRYFYIYIPSEAKSLEFTIDGTSGSGELDILIRHDQWPTNTEYDYSEHCQTDRKTVNITPLKTNTYYYVMAKGEDFSCIELMATYH